MSFKVSTRSPSKCILSGEHSTIYGNPIVTLALKQYTTVEGTYTEHAGSSSVSLILIINNKELNMSMSKAEFEVAMKPLLTSEVTVAQLAPSILDHFGQDLYHIALCFAITLKFFKKYSSHFSVAGFIDALIRFKGNAIVQAGVPMEAGLGSSASFFSALMLNIYVSLFDARLECEKCFWTKRDVQSACQTLHVEKIFLNTSCLYSSIWRS
jgi:mevalonate kinase